MYINSAPFAQEFIRFCIGQSGTGTSLAPFLDAHPYSAPGIHWKFLWFPSFHQVFDAGDHILNFTSTIMQRKSLSYTQHVLQMLHFEEAKGQTPICHFLSSTWKAEVDISKGLQIQYTFKRRLPLELSNPKTLLPQHALKCALESGGGVKGGRA